VLAVFAPFDEARSITRPMPEVPGTDQASSVAAVPESVAGLREFIAGVIIHAPAEPDDRMTNLVTELSTAGQAS
jgi:hypothetical protein